MTVLSFWQTFGEVSDRFHWKDADAEDDQMARDLSEMGLPCGEVFEVAAACALDDRGEAMFLLGAIAGVAWERAR